MESSITVLDNLNLQVNQNENIGIIGPSIQENQQLLNIIALLEIQFSGKIEISG